MNDLFNILSDELAGFGLTVNGRMELRADAVVSPHRLLPLE